MTVRIINADVMDGLAQLPDASVHCVVTSPPYWGLRNYDAVGQIGLEPTLHEHLAKLVEVFREVRRVLRPDGTLWLNYGDAYAGSWGAQSRGEKPGELSQLSGGQVHAAPRSTHTGSMKKTPGLKPKDLMLMPERLAIALCDDGWWIRSRIIWCLSGGTRVYARTQKGDMPMTIKDLVRLDPDTVKLWNGQKWTRVLGYSETPRPDVTFEIELRSGERIGCTAGHLWPTQRGNVRADALAIGDIIATCALPEPDAVHLPSALPDADIGWFVGTFLADGYYGKDGSVVQIASNSQETDRFSRLKRIAESYDGTFAVHFHEGKSASAHIYSPILAGVLKAYVTGENADGKHLNVRCWKRSNAFLSSLLIGYLEGDGSWDAKAGRWRVGFTANDALAADLRTICARIGAQIRLRRHYHESQWGVYPGWRGEIRLTVSAHHNVKDDSEIVAIRQSLARKFWDIGVEDDPHLFALASGVLTHNSKPNPMPESVTDRPTKSHEHIWLMSKSPKYFYDAEAIRERAEYDGPNSPALQSSPYGQGFTRRAEEMKRIGAKGNANGFRGGSYVNGEPGPRTATGNIKGRKSGNKSHKGVARYELGDEVHRTKAGLLKIADKEFLSRNCRDVWTIATAPFAEAHYATFPLGLAERCIKAGCPKGGTVLDPFGGSGTTGLVADRLQRSAILIELNPTYAEMARRRIAGDAGMFAAVEGPTP